MKITPILGSSMEPTIANGDAAIFVSASLKDIKIGDIAVFSRNKLVFETVLSKILDKVDILASGANFIGHRVVDALKINGKTYLKTQGDSSPTSDPWLVPSGSIRGKVIGKVSILENYQWFVTYFIRKKRRR